MQIRPNSPTAYPKANQPSTARRPVAKFAGNQKLKSNEIETAAVLFQFQENFMKKPGLIVWDDYNKGMAVLQSAFKNKENYEENHKKTLTTLQNKDKEVAQERAKQYEHIISTINASAEAAATNNTQNQPAPATPQSTNDSSTVPPANPSNSSGEQPTQTETTPKFRPREERTRLNVAGDVIKQYVMGRSKKVWWDLGLSAGIGAIFALGSPVMAVTIPTTMGVIGAYRLTQLAFKMIRDPKKDAINNMYVEWEKKEAEAVKEAKEKEAAKSAS